ncbi:MAG: ATP-binding protein [Candidatus Aenigmarchaeota archaeon]|nr:ATP-binding protein [Candidatus Aenigmarchaeota archaeon]
MFDIYLSINNREAGVIIPDIVVGRDDDDLAKYGPQGTVFIGKHIVGTGEDAHLTSPVLMDVLRPHILCLMGKRGSGKSFSLGIIAEEMSKLEEKIKRNLCAVIVDPQGVFWTMKSPSEKDIAVLREWGLEPKGFDFSVYVPEGQEKAYAEASVDYDATFSFRPDELEADDWLSVFGIEPVSMEGILFQRAFSKLSGNYSIDDMAGKIGEESGFEREKLVLQNYLTGAKSWGVFGGSRSPDVLVPGKVSILDVSLTPQSVRALLVSLISKKIFADRVRARRQEEMAEIEMTALKRSPMPWLMIDEAHNFIPAEGRSPSTDIIKKLVKEGRQPGITLVLATQQPDKLHPDALSQCDIIISHRLTAENDMRALKSVMQTYILYDIEKYINELPRLKGTAIILDDNSERLYKVRMRPRQSWHAGSSPTAM